MMTCKKATALHTEAREGALTGVWRLLYRLHMRICAPCQAYDTGLEQTIDALHALPKEPAPDHVKRAALEKLRARGRLPHDQDQPRE